MLPERCLTRSDTVSNSAEYGGYQLSYLPTTSIDFWPLLEACGPHWKTAIGGGNGAVRFLFLGAGKAGASSRCPTPIQYGFLSSDSALVVAYHWTHIAVTSATELATPLR